MPDHPAATSGAGGIAEAVFGRTAARFWDTVQDRCPGLLPEAEAPLIVGGLLRLVGGGDDRPGRLALLTVLGRVYREHRLRPDHADVFGAALTAAVPSMPLETATWRLVERAAARVGDGPACWPVEVLGRDRAGDTITILTVRPWRRLPFRPGDAVPVNVPQHPGRWRWYCPANAPRADGTVELHVRAVPGGDVSHRLAHQVRPGDLLRLGPPTPTGLALPDSPTPLLLVAGGTGLAPLRALVEQIVEAAAQPEVTLVVGARTFVDLYDAIALDKLAYIHPWLRIVPALSHDPRAEPGEQGDALTVALDHLRPDQRVYVCGPPAMLAGSRLRLLAAGVPADRIHLPEQIPWR
ncbi:oxidoreductase [Micromonospora fiedleri]|uniref:Oxidoreductase n=2 Tax=Micromonospora fiedleri TaxID=1157498 RepID=A0ABS1UIH5_9ACTN|nr:oxidoreductase [Micromonospora fiedleri]